MADLTHRPGPFGTRRRGCGRDFCFGISLPTCGQVCAMIIEV